MRLSTLPAVAHYYGSQKISKIYYNGNIVYTESPEVFDIAGNVGTNLQLENLDGFLAQEDGFLINVNYNNIQLNNFDGVILQDDDSYIFIDT